MTPFADAAADPAGPVGGGGPAGPAGGSGPAGGAEAAAPPSGGWDLLRSARPADVWLRYDVDPAKVEDARADGSAVAWAATHPIRRVRWLTAVADDPAAAAAIATSLARTLQARDGRVSGLTVPVGAEQHLPADLRPPTPDAWTWWWTDEDPSPRPAAADVVPLAGDDARIGPLLEHSGSAYVFPGDPKIVRWVGVETADGELVACAAHVEHIPGVPHLASVCTAPEHRGRGLAGDVCTVLTRDALAAGAPVVTLGMYAANTVAARVYQRLGFRQDKAFSSGWLPGQRPPDDAPPHEVEPADGGGTT